MERTSTEGKNIHCTPNVCRCRKWPPEGSRRHWTNCFSNSNHSVLCVRHKGFTSSNKHRQVSTKQTGQTNKTDRHRPTLNCTLLQFQRPLITGMTSSAKGHSSHCSRMWSQGLMLLNGPTSRTVAALVFKGLSFFSRVR